MSDHTITPNKEDAYFSQADDFSALCLCLAYKSSLHVLLARAL
jgi:hypothetical protein